MKSGLVRFVAACVAVGLSGLASTARAETQDPRALQAFAANWLRVQTAGFAGKVTINVAAPRATLPACAALDAFQPVGYRTLGKITLGVRCAAPVKWTVYLAAQVSAIGQYVVTRDALPPNHVIVASDLELRQGDLGALPADVATDVNAILNYRTVSALAAGSPLRSLVLRAPLAVQQGQVARLVLNGPGFSVQSEGQALANAARGESVRVKTASGQVVSGIAQDGQQVVIAY
jgi:flagella basal body P-ring formation protein FlgA